VSQSERSFRTNRVTPFLNALECTAFFPIQQVTIIGDADYILNTRGMFIWLELKKLKGKAAAMQTYKATWVLRTGGIALTADPDNWQDVKNFLSQLDGGLIDHDTLQRLGGRRVPAHCPQTKTDADEKPRRVRD